MISRTLKIIAIIVVVLLAGTYAIYALDYKGNYNLTASVRLNISDSGVFLVVDSLTEFSYDSEPTSVVQFWDLFRGGGHGPTRLPNTYLMTWELDNAGSTGLRTYFTVDLVERGESAVFNAHFDNEPPGTGTLKIIVTDYLGATLHQRTYDVVIG